MTRHSRRAVISTMDRTGLVPLFYHSNVETSKKVIESCYKGGARLVEFTSRGDFAHEVFGALNKWIIKAFPEIILGVGSITDAAAASLYMQLGANFIVTPTLREDIAIVCNRRKTLWLPGCSTLTEIARSEELGCEIVKLFPGDLYGPKFVEAIKKPSPWTDIMPTGGVAPTAESLKMWFASGVISVGMGSNLIVKDEKGNFNFDEIEQLTQYCIRTIKKIKNNV